MSASRKQASDITNRAGFFLRQLARRDGDGGPSSTVVGVIIVGVVIGFVALLVGIYVKHADRSRPRHSLERRHLPRGRRDMRRGHTLRHGVRQSGRVSPLKFYDVVDRGRGEPVTVLRDDLEMARPRRAHLR